MRFAIPLFLFIYSTCLFGLEGKIKVCTTTSLIGDLLREVGGDAVEVECLMGPGVDPHLYKATPSDLKSLSEAHIIFFNGLHLEGRMVGVLEGMRKQGKKVFPISEALSKEDLFILEGKEVDPHFWFDPRLWAQCVPLIAEKLSSLVPQKAHYFDANAKDYQKRLDGLFAWGIKTLKSLPKRKRILITSHDAYNYFGRAFSFQVIGIQGISTVSEASLADIVATIDFIKRNGVKAIFVETSVSPATVRKISHDAGVSIGGELFSDSLGASRTVIRTFDVGTYIGMVQYNIDTIVRALL